MTVTTEYSDLLKEKNARNDSLLPALDGDKAFAEVLRLNPNLLDESKFVWVEATSL